MAGLYAIRSFITGKWLSNLFEDTHKKTFQSEDLETAYYWDNQRTAEEIAKQECGVVIDLLGYEENKGN